MTYDFSSLNHADFEDLARDIIGRELGLRFEAFAPGPDGGIDGRHSTDGKATILQAKHYLGSTFPKLKAAMVKEREAINRLSPNRYLLATSRPLTPPNKKEIASIIGEALRSEDDIFGPGDLNGLLRKFPDITKSHIKLWLTSAAVLERILRSATHTFTSITADEIQAKLRVYAPNPSLDNARTKLEEQHVLIISGPPGVGKTTLAEMLSYAYIAEGWDLVAIRSLDDGFSEINDAKHQIFVFDDFFGRVALDRHALSHKDSHLARFLKRIRSSRNARFILTTRAYIFEEARRVSEHLADARLDVSKYVLDVGIYTRRIKARVLYNHLLNSGVPHAHIVALIESELLAKIVDHKNYNPRIIEWMTDVTRVGRIQPEAYPGAFVSSLNNPGGLWDIAFRTHIPEMCRHLLFALFFGPMFGTSQADLKTTFDSLHPQLCKKFGTSHDPKDFEESLRILEGSFLSLRGNTVAFVNPSIEDYLAKYLADFSLVTEFALAARLSDWAKSVWTFAEKVKLSPEQLKNLALAFAGIAARLGTLPARVRTFDGRFHSTTSVGLSNTDRIELLLNWWAASHDQHFADCALSLAKSPVGGFDADRDARDAIHLLGQVRDGDYFPDLSCAAELADTLENAVVRMLFDYGLSADDLESVSNAAEEWEHQVGPRVSSAVASAIRGEIENIREVISQMDSESELSDHVESIRRLGRRASVPSQDIEAAVSKIQDRISDIGERSSSSSRSPAFNSASSRETDNFDDDALQNLFSPLLIQDDTEP